MPDAVGMTVGTAYIMTINLIGTAAGAATGVGVQAAGGERKGARCSCFVFLSGCRPPFTPSGSWYCKGG